MERDIKQLLATSPKMRLQWRIIRDGIYENYKEKYKTKSSFSVVLHRTLVRLLHSGDVKKDETGHQKVFYSIPKRRQRRIEEELQREYAHKAFDEIWDVLTPEQRKKTVESLTWAGQSAILIIQEFIAKMAVEFKGLTEHFISQLENPTEQIKEKHSSAQRKQFLRELHILRGEWEKLGVSKTRTGVQDVKEELSARVKLVQEFIKNVVEPNYSGNWHEAMRDLMQKAVEQSKGKKRNKP